MSKLAINCFHKELPQFYSMMVVGKAGSGATTLVLDLLESQNEEELIVISPHEADLYRERFPKAEICTEHDLELLHLIITDQEKVDSQEITLVIENYPGYLRMNTLFQEILQKNKELKINLILIVQQVLALPPKTRKSFDFVFLAYNSYIETRQRLFSNYGSLFPCFDAFDQVFKQLTENYSFMVIDKKSESRDISDRVYWYKATQPVKKEPESWFSSVWSYLGY